MLRRIEISGFRGFEGLVLGDLAAVNVVVGRNGSGKSRLLEAIFASCYGAGALVFKQLAQLRGVPEFLPPATVAEYFGDFATRGSDTARMIAWFDDVTLHNVLRRQEPSALQLPPTTEGDHVQSGILATFSIDSEWTMAEQTSRTLHQELHILGNGRYWLPAAPAPSDRRLHLRSAKRLHETPRLAHWWGRAEEHGSEVTEVINACLREVYPEFESLRVVALENGMAQLRLVHRDLGACPPELFGDGLLETLHSLLLVADAAGGLVLVDEFGAACDPRTIEVVARSVVALARRLDVQMFVSSHSLETLDAFLLHTQPEELRVMQVARGAVGSIDVLAGGAARALREQHGFDLRQVA